MKKFISLLITLIAVFSCFTFTAGANAEYKVNIPTSSTGIVTITADKETANEGETVSLTASATDDYLINGVFISYRENDVIKKIELSSANGKTYDFVMPAADVRAHATTERNWHNEKVELDFSDDYGYGEVFLNQYYAYYGDELEIRVKPKRNAVVEYVTVNEVELPLEGMVDDMYKYTYKVDARKVTIDVKFRLASSTLYDVYIDNRIGGTGFADKKKANPGDTVTITVRPNSGKDFVKVTVDNKEISGKDNKFTFTMPNHNVTVDIICTAEDTLAKPTWERTNGIWKLKGINGKYIIGWYYIDSKWYFMDNAGNMKTGWVKDNNKWYYISSNGDMKTGWVKDNKDWYFMDQTGAMKTGWILSGDKWYYLYNNGKMAVSTYIDNNYKIGADGAWIK